MKKFMTGALALSMTAFAPSAMAAVQTVDFEGLSAGTVVTNQLSPLLTVSATNKNGNQARQAMIFDTNNFTGEDDDLAAPITDMGGQSKDFGNVLIISEDNNASDPDDAAAGGIIEFVFGVSTTVFSLDAIDINDQEGIEVTLFDENDVQIGLPIVNTFTLADNQFMTLDLGAVQGVVRMLVRLESSGAIDNLVVDPVPLPAALPFMATGLAGLAWMRRRRKVAA
ncbi:MAG: VPLPA-CTERM sorting domain-containing protein [Pseudomonadota bacterium]